MPSSQESFSSDSSDQMAYHECLKICKEQSRRQAEVQHAIDTEEKRRKNPFALTKAITKRQLSNKRSAEICRATTNYYMKNLEEEVVHVESQSDDLVSKKKKLQAEMKEMKQSIKKLQMLEENTAQQSWLQDVSPSREFPASVPDTFLFDLVVRDVNAWNSDSPQPALPALENSIDLNMQMVEEDEVWFHVEAPVVRMDESKMEMAGHERDECAPKLERKGSISPVSIFRTGDVFDIPAPDMLGPSFSSLFLQV